MSHSTLIENLRAKGEKTLEGIRRKADGEVEALKAELAASLMAETDRCGQEAERARHAASRKMAITAQRRASVIATRAEKQLDDRLYDLARGSLARLLEGRRPDVFAGLAREIPTEEWLTVTVHPDDEALAKELFPRAKIVSDPEMIGGLVAGGTGNEIVMVNTLENRLERLWPLLAPQIIHDLTENEKAG